MATLNDELLRSLLGDSDESGYHLPDRAALSKFKSQLEEAWRKINKMNLDEEKKRQALRNVEAKLEENYSKLDFKRKKELVEAEKRNRASQQEHLKQLNILYESIGDVTTAEAQKIKQQITELEEALEETKVKTSTELKKERKQVEKDSAEYKKLTAEIKQASKQEREARREAAAEQTKDALAQKLGYKRVDESGEKTSARDAIGQVASAAIANIAKVANKYLEQAETILNEYNSKISARLEGSGRTYADISKVIRQNLSVSAITQQTKVLENLSRLVDSGIAYNLEQRAFLATVKDDIAQTFDAFDSNLAQMIRLQREDSTYARLGLESSLQKFFNQNFLDTAYLTDMRRAVSGALIDAQATMNNSEATQFEYVVQKWLGSLYSMGASQNLISQIASGLNMLGTGNVQGLAGSPMQTLLAMAANRSGTDYATLLSGGLTSDKTNDLLKAMVEYLAEISESTKNNRIVSGAYNSIFNMSQADLRAIRNISSDISTIYNSTLNYNEMQEATTQGLYNIPGRLTLSARAKNVLENLKFVSASNLIENPITYLTLLATNTIEDLTGGINIEAAPFGIGVSAKITELIKSGLFGISFLSEVLGNLDNINNPGLIGSAFLNTNPGEMRGTGYSLTATSGTSQSYSAGGSSGDIQSQNFKNMADQQKQVQEGIQAETGDNITIEDIYYALVTEKGSKGHLSSLSSSNQGLLSILQNSFVPDLNAQRVVITGFNLDSNSSELPIRFGPMGAQQTAVLANMTASGIKGGDGVTLSTILQLLSGLLVNEEALNVNLKYSDVSFPDLVAGNAASVNEPARPSSGIVVRP